MRNKPIESIITALAPPIARLVIRLIRATMRVTYVNFDVYRRFSAERRQKIIAFWHGRLLMMPYAKTGMPVVILVSQSRDGELISRTVEGFGIEAVRGSSSKGWLEGVKGMLRAVRDGKDIAITPDGPRGPGMKAQMGAVELARRTGLPIFPLSFGASKKKPSVAGTPLSSPILSRGAYSSAVSPYT